MKKINWMIRIGLLLYVLLTVTDRFIVKLPDYLFIPIAITGIVFIFCGFIKSKSYD